jgi:hypothetical protein
MALCEYGLEVLTEAQNTAREKSLQAENTGKKVTVQLKCRHPRGCPMIYDASAKDGADAGGGIQSGFPCKTTGGRPN